MRTIWTRQNNDRDERRVGDGCVRLPEAVDEIGGGSPREPELLHELIHISHTGVECFDLLHELRYSVAPRADGRPFANHVVVDICGAGLKKEDYDKGNEDLPTSCCSSYRSSLSLCFLSSMSSTVYVTTSLCAPYLWRLPSVLHPFRRDPRLDRLCFATHVVLSDDDDDGETSPKPPSEP
jgi:hypothetical protein